MRYKIHMKHLLVFFLCIYAGLSVQKLKIELISTKGKSTKLPYSHMVLTAKLLEEAVNDASYHS